MALTVTGKWIVGTVAQDGKLVIGQNVLPDGEYVLYYLGGGVTGARKGSTSVKLIEADLI